MKEGKINIVEYVNTMREDRMNMIQNAVSFPTGPYQIFFGTFNKFRKIWHLLCFYFKEKDLILHFSNNGLFTSWQKLKIKQFVSIYRTNINFFTMFFMKSSEERVNFFPKTTSLEKWTARHCRTKLWTCLDFEKSSWSANWTLNPKVFIDIY